MTLTGDESTTLNPLTLMESAREKYTLARARREVPELALLSIHGAIEDTLRAHLLRLHSPAALGPFAGVIAAMQALEQHPLSADEADAVQRLHRLRGRIARGEHLAVTGETLAAYQRLAVMLLPRYGVQVVPDTEPARRRATQPMRSQTALPDDQPVRVQVRDRHTAYEEAYRIRSLGHRAFEANEDRRLLVPGWVAPALIVVSIFVIGLAIALSLQNPAPVAPPVAPIVTPSPAATAMPTSAPTIAPGAAVTPVAEPTITVEPTPLPEGLAVGRIAFVVEGIPALNMRAQPGLRADIPVLLVLAPGTQVEIIGGPVEQDGRVWWQVRSAGTEGWCAGDFLEVR
ncbi:SH3 domain-containing protein [Chloroflexus sp.]|uniref:SH3 domain-containing protein n=1 Tax=Chloroflexus sp. TaxID=1904827 RepID=UPI00263768E4|nr:SH3 domain-containing protein [uncultured Chloroflexus sp.]